MLIDGNMIMSGFVSKVVNEIVDIPGNPLKNAIKKADKDRKAKNQNIETRIYQVIIDAIKEFTKGTFKSEDTLYDAAEMIINAFRAKKENIEAVKAGLKMLESQITDDRCADFLGILCDEICKDENDILYKEIDLFQNEQTLREIRKGFEENIRNQGTALEILDDVREDTKYIRETLDNNKVNKAEYHSEIPVQNRAEEYAAKWHKNVFLNDFNKRDKNAGVNVKLKDIYLEEQLPHYTWKTDCEPLSDLKELLKEYTVDNDGKNMLLILGQPGIGKSTLITWIMANLAEKKEQVLVYQFASDLNNVNWQSNNILDNIFKAIGYSYKELDGKALILDGFDEIYINDDNRERILSKINQELKRMNFLKRFSLIITCRQNYVEQSQLTGYNYITLLAWNEEQIKSFFEIYEKNHTRKNLEVENSKSIEIKIKKILENKEVFGIPLILYMVLALNVDVEKNSSMVDIYDQIFSLKRGGIYDRCYDIEHRINLPEIKEYIHKVSQRIAFWIFENNSEKASIPQKEFKKICDNVINEAGGRNEKLQSDVLIGNYFTIIKHCEGIGTDELQFVHRSIYEYFITIYFFESLHNLTTKEEFAGRLGELLKDGHLTEQILEFLKYKFDKIKGYNLCDITREVFNKMLQNGMTYFAKEKYKNVIIREMNIFDNMLKVVHLWNPQLGKLDNKIVSYLQYNQMTNLNLGGIDLSGVDLREVNLREAYLREANLSGANLREANLSGVDLSGANLSEANLREADLSGVDLSGANLSGANLREANLSRVYLRGTDLRRADLREANLRGADLIGADLRGADLREVYLIGANLRGADLIEADLNGAYLSVADLREIYLRGADLIEAYLIGANLKEVDLKEIVLIGEYLSRTYLSEEDFCKVDFRGTLFDEKQVNIFHDKYDFTTSKVSISDTNEVIDYKDYCIRKKNE